MANFRMDLDSLIHGSKHVPRPPELQVKGCVKWKLGCNARPWRGFLQMRGQVGMFRVGIKVAGKRGRL
jgi:hypothetical protein